MVKEVIKGGGISFVVQYLEDLKQELAADTGNSSTHALSGTEWYWALVKHCVGRWTPLQIRLKESIFIMKRNDVID